MSEETPSIEVKSVANLPFNGLSGVGLSVFVPGVENYNIARINGKLDIVLDDETSRSCTVVDKKLGSLIELIVSHGPNSLYTYGKVYSPLNLSEILQDQVETPIKFSDIYTVIVVSPDPVPLPPVNPSS